MTDDYPPRLAELLAPPTGLVALAARHVESGRTWRHQEHRALPSASLIKLPILVAFWEAVEAGGADPAERVSVPAEARIEGTGVLKALAPGLQPTWSDLATLMITVSDNVATNLVIDRLGMGAIQAWIDKAGLAETRLERRMMDRVAMSAGRGNWTSAADMETLLCAIAAGTCVSSEASGQMRRVLEAQQIQDRLLRRLADGVRACCQQDREFRRDHPRCRHHGVGGRGAGDSGSDAGGAAAVAGDGHHCRYCGAARSGVCRVKLSARVHRAGRRAGTGEGDQRAVFVSGHGAKLLAVAYPSGDFSKRLGKG